MGGLALGGCFLRARGSFERAAVGTTEGCCMGCMVYGDVWLYYLQRCMGLYGCMAPGGRRDDAWGLYGGQYSEIQQKSIQRGLM